MAYLYDFYHLNWNDGPLPLADIQADQVVGVILKFTQGTSYETGASWAQREGARVRAAGLILGGYHMLDGDSSGNGRAQADYFLSKYSARSGDIVPTVDFEGSGQGNASLASYKARLLDFVTAVHAAGFECMLYGHSTVKAAFADWRLSGCDYWWVPGDTPHSDVGPRGPDLWQYSPYNPHPGWPGNINGKLFDASKVLTQLPIIGGDDMADDRLDAYWDGMDAYQAAYKNKGDDPGGAPDAFKGPKLRGWQDARFAATRPKQDPVVTTSGGLTVSQGDARYAQLEHGHKGTVMVA